VHGYQITVLGAESGNHKHRVAIAAMRTSCPKHGTQSESDEFGDGHRKLQSSGGDDRAKIEGRAAIRSFTPSS
jgi:hypothetical protein